jgi:hypothetical protein
LLPYVVFHEGLTFASADRGKGSTEIEATTVFPSAREPEQNTAVAGRLEAFVGRLFQSLIVFFRALICVIYNPNIDNKTYDEEMKK